MPSKRPKVSLSHSIPTRRNQSNPVVDEFLKTLLPRNEEAVAKLRDTLSKEYQSASEFKMDDKDFITYCQKHRIAIPKNTIHDYKKVYSRFFSRIVPEAGHIDYATKEHVPYEVIQTPGFPRSGSFGRVEKVGLPSQPTFVYARKQLFSNLTDEELVKVTKRELETLRKMKHPHIIELYGTYTFQRSYFLLLRPFVEYNLKDIFDGKLQNTVTGNVVLNWILDLSSALAYIHDQNVVHRDIKPENILAASDKLYIADFGLAKTSLNPTEEVASVSGTELYKAPEQESMKKWGRRADVFSLGCVFVDIMAYGNNISQRRLKQFFVDHGPKLCERSKNMCYRHNIVAVNYVLDKMDHKDGLGLLLDYLKFDMLQDRLAFRPSSADAFKAIVRSLKKISFFRNLPCCSIGPISKYEDASIKSLVDRMSKLDVDGKFTGEEIKNASKQRTIEEDFKVLLTSGSLGHSIFDR